MSTPVGFYASESWLDFSSPSSLGFRSSAALRPIRVVKHLLRPLGEPEHQLHMAYQGYSHHRRRALPSRHPDECTISWLSFSRRYHTASTILYIPHKQQLMMHSASRPKKITQPIQRRKPDAAFNANASPKGIPMTTPIPHRTQASQRKTLPP